MSRRVAAAVVVCAGCGRIGFGAIDDRDAAGTPDADPLVAPRPIVTIEAPGAIDDDPSPTGDLLELYFESDRGGTPDLWVSRRSSRDAPWDTPAAIPELDTPDAESTPEVSRDGLTLWFASDRAPTAGLADLWVTTRPDRGAPWSTPRHLDPLASTVSDASATGSTDGLVVVFSSNRTGLVGWDMFRSSRPDLATEFAPPEAIVELNTDGPHESGCSLDSLGLILAFDSNTPGGLPSDIYVAARPARDAPFTGSNPVTPWNTADNEADPWISTDLGYAVFVSDRDGRQRIYEAPWPP